MGYYLEVHHSFSTFPDMLPPGLFASPLLRSVAEVFSGRGMIFVFGYKDLWGLAIGFLWGLSPIVSIYFYLHLYTVFRFSKCHIWLSGIQSNWISSFCQSATQ